MPPEKHRYAHKCGKRQDIQRISVCAAFYLCNILSCFSKVLAMRDMRLREEFINKPDPNIVSPARPFVQKTGRENCRGRTHIVSSCRFTSSMSSKSLTNCATIAPYVRVKSSAFCPERCQRCGCGIRWRSLCLPFSSSLPMPARPRVWRSSDPIYTVYRALILFSGR
jgi:hypothetical protein